MKVVFADSGFWIAFVNPRDQLHERSQTVYRSLGPHRLVTSEMVLVEVFNGLATRGAMVRDAVVTLERGLRNQANVTVVPQTSASFREAVAHFAERLDQQWSLTDCSSFLIMRREGIIDALAHDRDFEQAGFRALLRDP